MWSYLLLGIAILVIAIFLGRWFASSPPATLARIVKWGGLVLGGGLAVFLAVTGKIGLGLIPLALIALPALIARMRAAPPGGGRPSPGQQSAVNTAYLRMTLDHDSGEMAGEALKGRFAGRSLATMTLEELLALRAECRADPPSAQLLEAFLDRVHGAEWRRGEGASAGESAAEPPRPAGPMSEQEAREILGVGPEAGPEEIKDAHRRLMLKLHPDQGGSTYLASKINQAKERLLGD